MFGFHSQVKKKTLLYINTHLLNKSKQIQTDLLSLFPKMFVLVKLFNSSTMKAIVCLIASRILSGVQILSIIVKMNSIDNIFFEESNKKI